MRRVARQGFLQRQIYSLFGYYPWECGACKKVILLRKRYQRKRSARQESSPAEQ